jgi:hypothetical protein
VEGLYLVRGARRPQLKRNPLGSIPMFGISGDPAEPAGRFTEVLVGLMVFAISLLGIYAGAKGAWAYLHGSRAATSDPLACALGLLGGPWFAFVGLRLLLGWAEEYPLLPTFMLPIMGLIATGFGVWFYLNGRQFHEPLATQVQPLYAFFLGAIMSFSLWLWRIRRDRRR